MLEGICVPSHCHRLKAEHLQDTYICDGCKERGTEWRYRCCACNYDMHNFCATASPSIPHPLSDSKMILLSFPVVKDTLWCSACERSVLGLRYSCTASGDVLHPCCARLPKTHTNNSITLRFSKSLSVDPCNWCGQRNRGWAYVSTEYSIHVHCLKEALETPKSPEFNLSSNHSSPQLCSGRLQLTAPPSTSNHQHSTAGYAASGTLQKYQPNKSNHGFKRFCKKTKLFLKAIRAILFGDPSSVLQVYATSFATDQ
ncbi:hypothetical protein SUGI_0671690 [Cryptomeria japonica]|uniref:uncharacterized protein LOC131078126 n=1 Tax=Cryptomeria japonica TaxID=3369 RepID=UPI0024147B4F|nr:uncharacterized protein LOC131078126 [Cryptomeria japonica]GLJ33394.1 hypothetical protein SUGI_0671690 [Cryptomeria japonica]